MSTETQNSIAEMHDPIPESSGRNPRGYGVGASSGTARRDDFCQRTDEMMEAVVERENMLGLVALLDRIIAVQNKSRTAVYGTVRTVV